MSKVNEIVFHDHREIRVEVGGTEDSGGVIRRNKQGEIEWNPPRYTQFTLEQLESIVAVMKQAKL